MTLRVAILTGTRADWGLLAPLARAMAEDPGFEPMIVATGTHLVERFGRTIEDIRRDGIAVADEIPILDDGDDAAAVIRALSRLTAGFGATIDRLRPDLVVLLGDRYEIVGAALTSVLAGIPIAHLCGGDVTEGAFDDSFRHAISKLAHLHFPSNAEAGRRLTAMGEAPDRIVVAGSTGLDALRTIPALSPEATWRALGLEPREKLVLATFHPPTLDETPAETQFAEVTAAFDDLAPDVALVLTGSNADPTGRRLTELAEAYATRRPNTIFRVSLGQRLYLSVMRSARAVVGNSSSGLYEAPSFGIATVNVGDRQKGRLRASSVLDVPAERAAIAATLARALSGDFRGTVNPYGDGHAVERIMARLRAIDDPRRLLVKTFHHEMRS